MCMNTYSESMFINHVHHRKDLYRAISLIRNAKCINRFMRFSKNYRYIEKFEI